MTDEKMIEEMARDLKNIKELQAIYKYTPAYFEAQCMFNLGYRKLPENAVVLTREDYNRIRSRERQVIDLESIMKAEEKARKETIKEVLDKVYDWGQGFFIEHSFMEEDEFNGILDEVKKLFLNVVEVEK